MKWTDRASASPVSRTAPSSSAVGVEIPLDYRFSLKNVSIAAIAGSSEGPSAVTVTVSPCLTPKLMSFISWDAAADFPALVIVTVVSL